MVGCERGGNATNKVENGKGLAGETQTRREATSTEGGERAMAPHGVKP